jgi:hypothetical protein
MNDHYLFYLVCIALMVPAVIFDSTSASVCLGSLVVAGAIADYCGSEVEW